MSDRLPPNPSRPTTLRRDRGGALALVVLAALACSLPSARASAALPPGLDPADAVPMADGVRFLGARVPERARLGGTLPIDLTFTAEHPLAGSPSVFVHIEAAGSACRFVRDLPLGAIVDGVIDQHVELQLGASEACQPQRLEVRVGIYDRSNGRRLAVDDPAAADDRIHASYFELVADGDAGPIRISTPSSMRTQRWFAVLDPWWAWIAGLALATLLAWLLRRAGPGGEAAPGAEGAPGQGGSADDAPRWLRRLGALAVGLVGLVSVLVAIDFVKDDAYISFRYAHNLVVGQGLVFNAHDRLEGLTNLLWTLLLVPFEALGLDLFQVAEVLGTALLGVTLWAMAVAARTLGASAWAQPALWPALWLAASSSVGLWTTSGMEQPLAMALPMAGAAVLWRSWREPTTRAARNDAAIAGVLVGLGCMTRPDIHLIGLLLALPLLVRAVRERKIDAVLLAFAAGGLAITVPGHLARLLYYGELAPNTYYVKTGGGLLVWLQGLAAVREMWSFNHLGLLILLAPLSLARPGRTAEKLVLLAISAGHMAYLVKVGRDEMHWHRLYLPALPFLLVSCGLGLHALVAAIASRLPSPTLRRGAWALGWVLVAVWVGVALDFTWREKQGWNGRGDLSGNYHPDMGKYTTRHARPGALVAFQDVGSTPYHAPDLDFFDFIGLVDRVVARTRHSYGLHAFLDTAAQRKQPEFDAEMRAYFNEQRPEWVILTTYLHGSVMDDVARRFDAVPTPDSLGPAVGSNRYQFGVYNEEFKKRYQHVRTWPRSRGYYLSLFELRSLYDQVPREVVFDAPPADVHGVSVEFERGVKLLGADLPAEAIAVHDFYLTLWLAAPGPLEEDWWVFVHLEKPGSRLPVDHVPGDWLYPANRWRAGDVIEDRTLVQLPPTLAPGEYDVFVGLYRRSTGKRLVVVKGEQDGGQRIRVGRIAIRAQRPFLDQLIRPTDLAFDRKHPERIVDHGRAPTAYAERAVWPRKAAPIATTAATTP